MKYKLNDEIWEFLLQKHTWLLEHTNFDIHKDQFNYAFLLDELNCVFLIHYYHYHVSSWRWTLYTPVNGKLLPLHIYCGQKIAYNFKDRVLEIF